MLRHLQHPGAMSMIRNSGLDFAFLDAEHAPYSMETMSAMITAARAMCVHAFVRVPELSRAWVSRVMDAGASGVMVPMIETKDMALELVSYAKYPPVGNRGITLNAGHTDFDTQKDAVAMMRECNAGTLAIAQIETRLAVENADDIASVDGIDVLLIGPSDLAVSLGHPGQIMLEDELEGIARVKAACDRHNKRFGMHAPLQMLRHFAPHGIDMILTLTDADLLIQGLRDIKSRLDAL